MRALTVLTRRALRRRPTQFAALSVVILLACTALYLGLQCSLGYTGAAHARGDELNAEDGYVLADRHTVERTDLTQQLHTDRRVARTTAEDVLGGPAHFRFAGHQTAGSVLFRNADSPQDLGRTEVISRLDTPVDSPAFVPISLAHTGGYRLGDELALRLAGREHRFHIQGFIENEMLGLISFGAVAIELPVDEYHRLAAERSVPAAVLLKYTTHDPDTAADVLASVTGRVGAFEEPGGPTLWLTGNTRHVIESSISAVGRLFGGVLAAVALVLGTVTVAVLIFLIRVDLAEEMTSVGVLKALGYRPLQALTAVVAPHLLVGLLAGTAGVAAGIALTPTVAGLLAAQSGLSWRPGPSPGSALAVLSVSGAAVVLTVLVTAHRVSSVPVVDALRGDIGAHNFRRNWLPLDRHPRLTLSLGLKGMLQSLGQSVMTALVVALTTIAMSFSVGLHANLAGHRDTFIGMVFFSTSQDLLVAARHPEQLAQLQAVLDGDPAVGRTDVLIGRPMTSGGRALSVTARQNYGQAPAGRLIAGREPLHANEIALGARAARVLGREVGEQVDLGLGETTTTYLVTGIIQSAEYLGMTADVTLDGLRRAEPTLAPNLVSVWLDTADAGHRADFLARIRAAHPDLVSGGGDTSSALDAQLAGYVDILRALAQAVLVVTAGVALLILTLTVRTQLLRRRRDDAVQFALGMTAGALRRQTLVSLFPPVVLGALLGIAGAAVLLDPMLSMLSSSLGIVRWPIGLDATGSLLLAAAVIGTVTLGIWAATRRSVDLLGSPVSGPGRKDN